MERMDDGKMNENAPDVSYSFRTWTPGIFSKWRRFSVSTASPCSMTAAAMNRSLARQHVSPRRLLTLDLPNQVGRLKRDGMKRQQLYQLVDVFAAALAHLRRPGAVDAMHQLGYRDRRNREFISP